MRTDYKFWYILQDDDGTVEEVAVRWYEGDYDGEGTYQRSRRLSASELAHLGDRDVKLESSGAETVIYTKRDFGDTKDLADVRAVLNAELAKDRTRQSIDQQVVSVDDASRLSQIEARR